MSIEADVKRYMEDILLPVFRNFVQDYERLENKKKECYCATSTVTVRVLFVDVTVVDDDRITSVTDERPNMEGSMSPWNTQPALFPIPVFVRGKVVKALVASPTITLRKSGAVPLGAHVVVESTRAT